MHLRTACAQRSGECTWLGVMCSFMSHAELIAAWCCVGAALGGSKRSDASLPCSTRDFCVLETSVSRDNDNKISSVSASLSVPRRMMTWMSVLPTGMARRPSGRASLLPVPLHERHLKIKTGARTRAAEQSRRPAPRGCSTRIEGHRPRRACRLEIAANSRILSWPPSTRIEVTRISTGRRTTYCRQDSPVCDIGEGPYGYVAF